MWETWLGGKGARKGKGNWDKWRCPKKNRGLAPPYFRCLPSGNLRLSKELQNMEWEQTRTS